MTPKEPTAQDWADQAAKKLRRRGWFVLFGALAPAIVAVWNAPAFETQDGPAHLYNAHVLVESLRADSPFASFFEARWSPLPNWLGHVMGMGLVAALPFSLATRLATTIPLVGLAAASYGMQRRVSEDRRNLSAPLFAVLLSLNVCWLFGFTSFLLGACLFPITLGYWWSRRESFGPKQAAWLATLMVVGYFAHVVSLGLTVVGLVVLALTTPGARWKSRTVWTAVGLGPLAVLLPIYRGLMTKGGPLQPGWGHWKRLLSLDSWRDQIGWVDPISLGSKRAFPLVSGESNWLGFLTPPLILLVAIILFLATQRRYDRERRGWLILSAILLIGGFVSPDTLGPSHGNYLPQRIILLGFVAMLGWLDFSTSRVIGKVAFGLLAAALLVQTLTVVDYARESSGRMGPFVRTRTRIGRNQRIGTLLIGIKGRFRANPLLHADNWLGLGTGNVMWADYETAHYYFPVQFRTDIRHPAAGDFEAVALREGPNEAETKAKLWSKLLETHHKEIDILMVWGDDERLAKINAQWFDPEPIDEDGPLRAYKHR